MENFDPVKYINTPNWQASRLGLERIRKLLELLGNPQKKLRFVHVAGTNGKGSTCAYFSQILIESGYKTGQFTSPYIYAFSERIRINNKMISDKDLEDVTLRVKNEADKFAEDDHPTEFELMTAVAFTYFASQKCDIVVSEVGMGGRLDSTNVIEADETLASVVTTIDFDHMQFLGDTLEEIAAEKAGIFKAGVPIISADQKPEVKKILEAKASDLSCEISFVDFNEIKIEKVDLSKENLIRKFSYKEISYETKLLATYQPQNAVMAIETANLIYNNFDLISNDSIKDGIKDSNWPARFEIISKQPYVVLDGGHNVQGVNALIDSLTDVFGDKKFIFVMGVLADKDYEDMVKVVAPHAKKAYTITPPNPRKLSAEDLAATFSKFGLEAKPIEISKAISTAKKEASESDIIAVFGSLYSISSLVNI